MKTALCLALLIAVCVFTARAQEPYSNEFLEKASPEELDVYLNKALKLQQTGRTLNITGVAILGGTLVSSLLLADQLELGVVILAFFGGVAGLGTLAVGIPMNLTGKSRAERIRTYNNRGAVYLRFKPETQYHFATQNYKPALTLSICF